jgi:hypothetical protein
MDSVQERIRFWREEVKGRSLRQFQGAVDAQLPSELQVSLGTVANYERAIGAGGRRAGPRAEFVAGLKRACPELRLAWLLLGEGEPTELGQTLAREGGLEGDESNAETASAAGGESGAASAVSLTTRILARYPDLELLAPEASALFTAALTRYAMGEPGMEIDEEQLLKLAGDLRWLLWLPVSTWGFDHEPGYERFSAYCVAMLQALMLAMPSSGRGDPIARHGASIVARLRAEHEVGFGVE